MTTDDRETTCMGSFTPIGSGQYCSTPRTHDLADRGQDDDDTLTKNENANEIETDCQWKHAPPAEPRPVPTDDVVNLLGLHDLLPHTTIASQDQMVEGILSSSGNCRQLSLAASTASLLAMTASVSASPNTASLDAFKSSMAAAKLADRVTCDLCKKELCNKYFLRTHKIKVHGISPKDAGGPTPRHPIGNCTSSSTGTSCSSVTSSSGGAGNSCDLIAGGVGAALGSLGGPPTGFIPTYSAGSDLFRRATLGNFKAHSFPTGFSGLCLSSALPANFLLPPPPQLPTYSHPSIPLPPPPFAPPLALPLPPQNPVEPTEVSQSPVALTTPPFCLTFSGDPATATSLGTLASGQAFFPPPLGSAAAAAAAVAAAITGFPPLVSTGLSGADSISGLHMPEQTCITRSNSFPLTFPPVSLAPIGQSSSGQLAELKICHSEEEVERIDSPHASALASTPDSDELDTPARQNHRRHNQHQQNHQHHHHHQHPLFSLASTIYSEPGLHDQTGGQPSFFPPILSEHQAQLDGPSSLAELVTSQVVQCQLCGQTVGNWLMLPAHLSSRHGLSPGHPAFFTTLLGATRLSTPSPDGNPQLHQLPPHDQCQAESGQSKRGKEEQESGKENAKEHLKQEDEDRGRLMPDDLEVGQNPLSETSNVISSSANHCGNDINGSLIRGTSTPSQSNGSPSPSSGMDEANPRDSSGE
ncbi:unnamed protein product [Protopolystoma xenopodis]|uniref:C2H2-type domain-containing protein n=1 Tax=Protopolystoma xenopodis TaxID=117903 RepID=A0A448WKV9_9PLAT|nr:unnamed protein product [Protopolystoma xenopodis]